MEHEPDDADDAEDESEERAAMNRRIWTGVVAGVLAAAVLLTVGIGAYRAGQDDEVVTRVVSDGEPGGEVVRVIGDHRDFGPGPFFFLIPLLVIVLVVLLARRASGHRWGHGWGHGGPGWHRPYGPGPGYGPGDRSAWFDEWHRRAHEEDERRQAPAPAAPAAPSAPAPGPDEPPASPPSSA